jgi:hypothetical protein
MDSITEYRNTIWRNVQIFRFWIFYFHYSYFCKKTCKYKHDAGAVYGHGGQWLKSNFIYTVISTTGEVNIGAPVVKSMINTI